jgi:Leucine-rich repeat (LRR) protein
LFTALADAAREALPDSVWEQTELETLVLADNGLEEVSEQIGRLKKLRMLDLGHTKLTHVPDAMGDLDDDAPNLLERGDERG